MDCFGRAERDGELNLYYCAQCCKIVSRNSKKKKIKCDDSGKISSLNLIESSESLAYVLRKKFLSSAFDISTYKPKEVALLETAFEQGVVVTFNAFKK